MSTPYWATDESLDKSLQAERVYFKYRKDGRVHIVLKLTNGDVAFTTIFIEDLSSEIAKIEKGYCRLLAGKESEQKSP